MFEFLKDFIFPKRCLGCERWGEYLCSNCVNFVKLNDSRICPMCNKPSVGGLVHPACRRPWGLDGLTSIFVYQGVLKRAITKLKYRFVTDLAETILELFLSFVGEDKAFTKFVSQENVLLVPVPLYWQRKNWRGFNQAELLGEKIAEKLNIDFLPDLLIRTRKTKPQTKLTKKERQRNVFNAFTFNQKTPTSYLRRSILLFDDVWTTGATMRECTKVVKRNRIKRVWGLTLACQP